MNAMRRTVLVVEDEQAIAELIEMYLVSAGYNVLWAPDGRGARRAIEDPSLALVILDLMLPDTHGLDLLREIRSRGDLPVIVVTARDSEPDRVAGLELGADDYVTKPFSPRELAARVSTVLRRGEHRRDGSLCIGKVRIDPSARELTVDGSVVDVTRKELDLLFFLMEHPGRVFTRSQLLDQVWDYGGDVDSRTVDVHVAQLRRKLGADCPVRTVRGVGYKAG